MTENVTAGQTTAPAVADMLELGSSWMSAVGSRCALISRLALAEARLAGISVALMAFLAMIAAAFVLIAWGLMMAGLIFALAQWQLPLWPAFVALGGLHALLAWMAWRTTVRLSQNLEFPVTRYHLADSERQPSATPS